MRTAIGLAAVFFIGRYIYLNNKKQAEEIIRLAQEEAERLRNAVPPYNPNADNWNSACGC